MKKKETPTDNEERILLPNKYPVVGIGASAGGLAAFEAFFSGMPLDTDPGMAFVIVQHLAPDHKSILSELIRKYTRMEVLEAEDGMLVKCNCAYIIPPGYDMSFSDGCLQLTTPTAPRGQRLPIDFFFRSLALDQHEKAVCIILSGNGNDGTMGLRAIKGEGGLVLVQKPESTEYDGMPRSALATGLADYELLPEKMPAQLISYATQTFGKVSLTLQPIAELETSLNKIFQLLQTQTGHDFSQYKLGTIQRRIERSMAIQQIETIENFTKYLEASPDAVDALFRDLLIGVTNFFRDPEVFKRLEDDIIPKLFEKKSVDSIIRIWVPGCSTGEEAYSLAILLQERMNSLRQNYKIQIFATDIDARAISYARAGLYHGSIAQDITPERLNRFFIAESNHTLYRIQKSIRDMLVFSEHDLIKDPPFSKLDLVTCRNLLIYLGGELQKKIIPLFHYALKPNGILLLGTSETIGDFNDLFIPFDRKLKLYQRKEDYQTVQRSSISGFLRPSTVYRQKPQAIDNDAISKKMSVRNLTEQAILQLVMPCGALVNSLGDILYLHGRTGLYLEPAPGESGINNILKMAREGLKRELTLALHKAIKTKEIVRQPGLQVKTNGHFTRVNLTVRSIDAEVTDVEISMYLITLEEVQFPEIGERDVTADQADQADQARDSQARIEKLKQELHAKENYLQAANEELETSNEELKSSNEEMQSINEELQSTNEELETSKEEMQSVNEELATVNSELVTKVTDLSRANNDMNNLLSGTGIATVFVDHSLRILRFTPATTKIINLILGDIGRPIGHILSNLVNYDKLTEDTQTVLDSLVPKEIEVQTRENRWYALRILPYRTLDNIIEGAVITFIDITESKLAKEKIRSLLEEKEIILKEVHHRIKNNMNTIHSLLSLQTHSLTDKNAIAALEDAGNRVHSMMVLYDKLYYSTKYQEISIRVYLPSLVDEIIANFPNSGSVKVEKKIDDFIIDARKLQPLGIIINELLTNIMKYAFIDRSDGVITVSASVQDKLVTLSIEDNGNGIPGSIDFDKSAGFGLTLVSMLAEQLQGSIRLERDNGTKFILEFAI